MIDNKELSIRSLIWWWAWTICDLIMAMLENLNDFLYERYEESAGRDNE